MHQSAFVTTKLRLVSVLFVGLLGSSSGAGLAGCAGGSATGSTPAKEITAFTFSAERNPALEHDIDAVITGTDITATLPFGTDVSALRPTVEHTGASLSPESGAAQDFSAPVPYTVTASDQSTAVYHVTVTLEHASSAKDITTFTLAGIHATISGTQIAVTLPFGTDVSALTPTLELTGSSVSPSSAEPQNFAEPVEYTVTAADGSTKTYTVTVTVASASSKDITQFTILGVDGSIGSDTIKVVLPYGTDVSALNPNIVHTGASISPKSGTARDFTAPVVYTVTAADNSTREYTVSVEVAQDSSRSITAFSILGVAGAISGTTITLSLPFGTDVSALVPSVTYTGMSLSPASGVTADFSNPQLYTVTAANGATKTYTVTVTVSASSAKSITSFSVLGIEADISGSAITLGVPNGTDLTLLAPDIVYEGASITPASGEPRDFTSPVTYTVTAADGSSQDYTVTISALPNSTPVVSGGLFVHAVTVANGDVIGTVTATDADSAQTHTFAITADDSGGMFSIDSNSGVITVSDATLVASGTYTLTVSATDDGTPPETGSASVTVKLVAPPAAVADGPLKAYANVSTSFGVVDNDSAGTPAASVASFGAGSLGGAVSDHPADGTPVPFAGGQLSLDATGALTVNAATPGSYTFNYRLSNGVDSDATVSLVICSDLTLGDMVLARPESASSACVGSSTGSGNPEFVFVPMNLTASGTYSLSVMTSDTATISGATAPTAGTFVSADGHAAFRAAEHAEIAARHGTMGSGSSVSPASAIPHAVPAVNDVWSLNDDVSVACSSGTAVAAKVQAVGTHSIVVSEADDLMPIGGFTTAMYETFSWTFDNVIYPAVTTAYGDPTDSDENGRVVLFITPAINRLSPPASSGVQTRHMTRDHATQVECPTSNAGEIIYIQAPDPTGSINSNVRTVSSSAALADAAVAHEFAHLVLDSRRLAAGAPFEEPWLDEALAGFAEELSFYTATSLGIASVGGDGSVSYPSAPVTGIAQFSNIITSNLTTGANASRRVQAFNNFANTNFGRYRTWLQGLTRTGVTDNASDNLAQRGSSYTFLRYLTDRMSGGTLTTANSFLADLVDADVTGLDNIAARIGDDPTLWLRDFLLGVYIDDSGIANLDVSTLPYRITSWNYPSLFVALSGWPLATLPAFTPNTPVTFNLAPGGTSHYVRFQTNGSTPATVTLTPPEGTSWDVWYAIFRKS